MKLLLAGASFRLFFSRNVTPPSTFSRSFAIFRHFHAPQKTGVRYLNMSERAWGQNNRHGAAEAPALWMRALWGHRSGKAFNCLTPLLFFDPSARANSLAYTGNPTGAVCPRDTMVEIAQLCKEHNTWLVVDQAYEHFLHGDQRYSRSNGIQE